MRNVAVGLALAFAAGTSGCGSGALRSGGPEAGSPVLDAAPELVTVGVPVQGTFVAPGVSASIAFPNGAAFLRQDSSQAPAYGFHLLSGDVASGPQVTFDALPDLVSAAFDVSLQVGAPLPREFPSTSGCGDISVTGSFPPDVDASCGGVIDAGVCPPGCVHRITLEAGDPECLVRIPTVSYRAVTNCSDGGAAVVGDWTLSLSAVDSSFLVDGVLSSPGLYLVHGTLTAQLVGAAQNDSGSDGGDAGLATGTLRLDF